MCLLIKPHQMFYCSRIIFIYKIEGYILKQSF